MQGRPPTWQALYLTFHPWLKAAEGGEPTFLAMVLLDLLREVESVVRFAHGDEGRTRLATALRDIAHNRNEMNDIADSVGWLWTEALDFTYKQEAS